MGHDLRSELAFCQSIKPGKYSSTNTGVGCDLQNTHAQVICINVGTHSGGGVYAFSVDESQDNSTWSSLPASEYRGTLPVILDTTNDEQAHELGIDTNDRYLRVVCTVTGTPGSGISFSATVITGTNRGIPY